MVYAGYWIHEDSRSQKTAIGSAWSRDGINWTKNPSNPILTPSPNCEYDSVYASSQCVLRDGDIYRLYYAGRVNRLNKYFSIALATKTAVDPGETAD